ncbi:Rv0361 family membrane protein [Polymorphospora rubra]|uniref:Rv0361 family membrane protein n=1 Tax=Polymorphospora rubra TaxID=338584 RepID=UPI003F4D4873
MRRGGVLFGAVLLGAALAGCGDSGSDEPTPDAGERARERVQAYLDAMKAKDVAAGRAQLCAAMQATFDRIATGPNGDFAAHFTVPDATIDGVRAEGAHQLVDATVTVAVAGEPGPVGLVFTVTLVDGHWCISDEVPAPAPKPDDEAPTPASTPSPSRAGPAGPASST